MSFGLSWLAVNSSSNRIKELDAANEKLKIINKELEADNKELTTKNVTLLTELRVMESLESANQLLIAELYRQIAVLTETSPGSSTNDRHLNKVAETVTKRKQKEQENKREVNKQLSDFYNPGFYSRQLAEKYRNERRQELTFGSDISVGAMIAAAAVSSDDSSSSRSSSYLSSSSSSDWGSSYSDSSSSSSCDSSSSCGCD